MALKKKKTVTIKEEALEETPEIVKEEENLEIEERDYDRLVALPREEFLKVQALVRAWKAKFKPQ